MVWRKQRKWRQSPRQPSDKRSKSRKTGTEVYYPQFSTFKTDCAVSYHILESNLLKTFFAAQYFLRTVWKLQLWMMNTCVKCNETLNIFMSAFCTQVHLNYYSVTLHLYSKVWEICKFLMCSSGSDFQSGVSFIPRFQGKIKFSYLLMFLYQQKLENCFFIDPFAVFF